MKDIAIYGAGGFGREIACLINLINEELDEPRWKFIGFYDDNIELKGKCNEYGQVMGGRDELNRWPTPIDIAIAIGTPQVVKKVAESISNENVEFPNIIAPSVTFLDKENVRIGRGNILCTNCLISTNIDIGDFNLFNGFIGIGHDTSIGSYNVVMPSCNISGGVKIGDCNFMGLKSAILQNITVGNDTRIGTGAVVMKKTKDGYLYAGIPAVRIDM